MRYRRRVYIPPTTISIADSMSSVIRPPDPCLIAIALVVRSRAGPRFVYHYPPNPSIAESPSTLPNRYDQQPKQEEQEDADPDQEVKGTDSGASVDEEGVTSEDESSVVDRSEKVERGDRRSPSRSQTHAVKKKVAIQGPGEGDAEEKKSELMSLQADSFLGLKYGVWEKLLSPSPAWHKRRFEVGVNDLTFVGWPVFVRKDGTWRKRKKKREKHSSSSRKKESKEEEEKGKKNGFVSGLGAVLGDLGIPMVSVPGDTDAEDGGDEEEDGSDEEQLTIKDGMTMFNVVFVLNPPTLEYNVRVREMYDNVVKKFGKALKSEQARANYVWKEVQNILRVKEKCREESRYFMSNIHRGWMLILVI